MPSSIQLCSRRSNVRSPGDFAYASASDERLIRKVAFVRAVAINGHHIAHDWGIVSPDSVLRRLRKDAKLAAFVAANDGAVFTFELQALGKPRLVRPEPRIRWSKGVKKKH